MSAHEQRLTAPALVDYPEAQRYLGGISRSTLKVLVGSGKIRTVTIGRRRLIPMSALDNYIETRLSPDAA